MYEFTLQTYGEVFAQAQPLTGTAVIGNQNIKPEAGQHLGGLSVSVLANGPVTVATGAHILVAVETSDTTTDADFKPLVSFNTQGQAADVAGFSAVSGQKLAWFPLPEAKRYVRVKLSGGGVTGTVDCILEYVAR